MKYEDTLVLNIYRNAVEAMKRINEQEFPVGSVVFVDTAESYGFSRSGFIGLGIVRPPMSPDEVAVLVQSGNTWSYPIECCHPYAETDCWPDWITLIVRTAEEEKKRRSTEPPF